MITPKKLLKLARKWQKQATLSRKRLTFPTAIADGAYHNTSARVEKGHFVVYSADQRRFVIPLIFLQSKIFRELLRLAEEEYGMPSDGPITLPCDEAFVVYAISVIERHATTDMEKALLKSITTDYCVLSSNIHKEHTPHQQLLVCSF
ncbi:auxin-responsive protein SAUR67-like [Heracleum sosnowskyi]|uniref:Auxin-responsive protein SAUR67-like n=1 Tax=Heracleum sosnowskyi TaxID=360622 RepID=A0AAD8MEY4_9APIA|nr:auxin-responsive protein SAUR67-like [Heracleum sosnowskyi]